MSVGLRLGVLWKLEEFKFCCGAFIRRLLLSDGEEPPEADLEASKEGFEQ
jgi:hypothetical protein